MLYFHNISQKIQQLATYKKVKVTSVTCHPTQVNTPRLNSSQTGRYTRFTYSVGMEGWVDLGDLLHAEMPTRRRSPIRVLTVPSVD